MSFGKNAVIKASRYLANAWTDLFLRSAVSVSMRLMNRSSSGELEHVDCKTKNRLRFRGYAKRLFERVALRAYPKDHRCRLHLKCIDRVALPVGLLF